MPYHAKDAAGQSVFIVGIVACALVVFAATEWKYRRERYRRFWRRRRRGG
jgi:hypothetical protein